MPIACVSAARSTRSSTLHLETYAQRWGEIIPRCGGELVGNFVPGEGTNDFGYGLITRPSLSEYEAYRARLRAVQAAHDNFAFWEQGRLVLREEQSSLTPVMPRKPNESS